jgi:hypothetical protein
MLTDMSGEFERNAGVREFKQAIEGEIAGVRKDLEEAGVSVKKDLSAAAGTANKAASDVSRTIKGAASTTKTKSSSSSAKSGTANKASTSTAKATTTARLGKPKATKEDPYAGLVQLTEAAPKKPRAAAVTTANGSNGAGEHDAELIRETSEAVARARERRLAAGYNRRLTSST